MGCCGKNRMAQPVENNGPPASCSRLDRPAQSTWNTLEAVFHRFWSGHQPALPLCASGALLAVDERDGPSMAGVPNLRGAPAPE